MTGKDTYGITVLHPKPKVPTETTPSGIVFDLVAIHGLNGHAYKTWTHEETGVMWLEHLLPVALPDIRVMTFGYNARFRSFTAQQDLRSISSKLLAELVEHRKTDEERRRPIVLICHSLGGIIAKKALLIGCSEEQERVQQSVYGILFLGTPHNGSSLAAMGKLVANIASACSPIRPPRALIGALAKDSKVLLEITEDFIKRRREVQFVSFYELELTSIGPFLKKMIVEHHSAILNVPHEITVPQFADHRNIVRFTSHDDRSFRPVVSRLEGFVHELRKGATEEQQKSNLESDFSIPFDMPALPCTSFCGRDDVLEAMNTYFHGEQDKSRTRRTFALCGLGGLGKTQTILHYVVRKMSKYPTGVAFVNSTSEASIARDFERLHDLLKLGESKNKISSVKSWLSRQENSRWLLVFDNADDLNTVPVQEYFPAVNWGHIIVTSRDQAVIGSITEEGQVLTALAKEDATHLLLEKSGVRNPTVNEVEEAQSITELLGFLPLALVQAGAFIRSRHKSLADYNRLYKSRREDLLSFSARLGDTNKAVMTTWEINFRQVEQESLDATYVLLLFSFLEPTSIPEMILRRGSSPQRRWGSNGEVTEIRAEDEGVDKYLIKTLQDDFKLDMAVEKLLSFSLISCSKDSNGLRNFSIHPLVQYCATQRLSPAEVNRWRWQALLLVCHAFPRNQYIELLGDAELGRLIMPHLSKVLSDYDVMCIEYGEQTPFRRELASTLLAASRFSDAKWKVETIGRTKKLLENDDDPFLNAWLSYRESSIARMSGMSKESEHALERFLHDTAGPLREDPELTPSFNAQRGNLIISFSENLISQGDFKRAEAELMEWSPLGTSPSAFERIISRARDITLAKLLRYEGRFKEALALLDGILQASVRDDFFEGTGWYHVLLSGVTYLYCELGRPAAAEELLMKELRPMREKGTQDTGSGKRLQLSLAETYLQRYMYSEAESVLQNLQRGLSSSSAPGHSTNTLLFRTLMSLARMYHKQSRWDQAISHWKDSMSVLKRLKRESSHNADLVRSSIAHALLMNGQEAEGKDMLQNVKENMELRDRIYWIPMFNSKWHDFIVDSLKNINANLDAADA